MTEKKEDMALLDWEDEVSPIGTEKQSYLEQQRIAWQSLEEGIKKVLLLPWEELDNIESAKIPKALDLVHVLHHDYYEYQYLPVKTSEGKLRIKRPSLHLNNGLTPLSIFYGFVKSKKDKSDTSEGDKEISYTVEDPNVPRYINAILDYLTGTISIFKDNIYMIKGKEFQNFSQLELAKRYKFPLKGSFTVDKVEELIKFIHSFLKLKPVKDIKTAVIACNDFQIDLKNKKIFTDTAINEKESYFKVFDCNYREVMDLVPKFGDYLSLVTDNKESEHNASLQPIYIALIACREMGKARFFISKSGERTGKGLRHKIISTVFKKQEVFLDALTGKSFDALNAWAGLDGGEFLLATEQGEITGKPLERVLKHISTEDSHPARLIGGNMGDINLTGVLSIDTNEKVQLNKGMDSRVVNIAFANRPALESEQERYKIFSPYWEAFTAQTQQKTTPQATTTAGVASLVHSFLYWQTEGFKFNFKQVEHNNFIGDFEFDEVQAYLIERSTQGEKTFIKTGNEELKTLLEETYRGQPRNTRKEKLSDIGLVETSGRIMTPNGYKPARVIKIKNNRLFQKAVTAYLEKIME